MNITLIIDASSPLSIEFAKIYAARKQNILLVSYTDEELFKLKEELFLIDNNLIIDIYKCNIEDQEELNKLYVYLAIKEYHIERLIANIDYSIDKHFINLSNEEINIMMNINNNSYISLAKHSLIDMDEIKSGELILVSNLANDSSLKNATSAFNEKFTTSLTTEYQNANIKFLVFYIDKNKISKMDNSKYAVRAVNAIDKNKKILYYSFKEKIKKIFN